MQLIGFNFTKISSKRELEQSKEKLKVSYNIEIIDIAKESLNILKEDNILRFAFKYTISYEPKFASIEFEGHILLVVDSEKQKNILKEWKKKKVPEEMRLAIFNLVMMKCNIKALQMAEDLAIPPHIPLPQISPAQSQNQENNYTG